MKYRAIKDNAGSVFRDRQFHRKGGESPRLVRTPQPDQKSAMEQVSDHREGALVGTATIWRALRKLQVASVPHISE